MADKITLQGGTGFITLQSGTGYVILQSNVTVVAPIPTVIMAPMLPPMGKSS